MKTCSKCKKDQPKTNFVKSPRYRDGLYPICKTCRKETRLKGLSKTKFCKRCKANARSMSNFYCETCQRKMRGRKPITLFKRRASTNGLCCRCHKVPPLKYHWYCKDCQRDCFKRWWNRKGKNYKHSTPERREKYLARVYLHQQISRGKLKRQPCVVCGNPKSEGHHHNGYRKEHALDVVWLCKKHHDEAERVLKSKLTEQPLLL